ncbi:MAG: YjgP/YjgQ family permease [Opitutales bacterium]|nr:YjgP/YjgQ family permease [Opitutales bacterium]
MRILDRHVLVETAITSIVATGAFVFVLVGGNVLKKVVGAVASGQVSTWQGVELVGLLFPGVIPYALPMGVLTGFLIAFGRMSSQNEITAMKAGGIKLLRIARPALILAASFALLAAWLNLEIAPLANTEYKRLLVGSAQENPASIITPGELNRQFKGLVIRAGSRDDDVLKDFWLWRLDNNGKLVQSIQAKEARLERIDKPDGSIFLRVRLKEARMESRVDEKLSFAKPSSFAAATDSVMEFPADAIFKDREIVERKLRWLTTSELLDAMDKGWQVTPQSTPDEIAQGKMEARKQLMAHLASAFSIFTLALLAIPLAMRVGRSETFVNAAIALGICLSYYVLSSVATWVKSPALRPDILVWVPNIIVLFFAIRLIKRSEQF